MLGRLGALALLLMCVASVIGVFVRFGNARGEERQQIKWFAYAAALLLAVPFLIVTGAGIVIEAMGGVWEVGDSVW
jgi:TRAP-type mannitol/chloroaromatic compound transport system permease small subunit